METLLPPPYHSSCSGVEILSTPETYCFHGQLCWQTRKLPATPVSLLSSLLNRTLSGVCQIPGTMFTCTVALWCVTLASSCTGLLSRKRPMLGLMVCCCCCCLEILNNLIFELSFVCEACWGDGARASAEETHWVAAYAHMGSGMREVCTPSIGLDAQCPWPHLGTVLGTVKFPGGSGQGPGPRLVVVMATATVKEAAAVVAVAAPWEKERAAYGVGQGLWWETRRSVHSCSIYTNIYTVNRIESRFSSLRARMGTASAY